MTATDHHPTLSDSSDSLLRFAMRADATAVRGPRPAVAFAADPLSRLSGLSADSEWIAGAALVALRRALYVLAAAPDIRRIGVGIVAANVVFAVAVVAVLAAGVLPLTGAGVAMMLATVAATLGFAVPAVPRSAPAGVTPSAPVRGRPSRRGCGERARTGLSLSHRKPNQKGKIHDRHHRLRRRHRPRTRSCASPCASTPWSAD